MATYLLALYYTNIQTSILNSSIQGAYNLPLFYLKEHFAYDGAWFNLYIKSVALN